MFIPEDDPNIAYIVLYSLGGIVALLLLMVIGEVCYNEFFKRRTAPPSYPRSGHEQKQPRGRYFRRTRGQKRRIKSRKK